MYLYKARIITNTNEYTMTQAEKDEQAANDLDFDNYIAQCLEVDDVIVADTTFQIYKTYPAFKALITGNITWADVKYTDAGNQHKLFLITNNPI